MSTEPEKLVMPGCESRETVAKVLAEDDDLVKWAAEKGLPRVYDPEARGWMGNMGGRPLITMFRAMVGEIRRLEARIRRLEAPK